MVFSSLFSLLMAFRHLSRAARSLPPPPTCLVALKSSAKMKSTFTGIQTARDSVGSRLSILEAGPYGLKGVDSTHRKAWGLQYAAIVGQSCSLLCSKMMATIAPSSFFGHNVDLPFDMPARKKKPFLRPLKADGKKLENDAEESLSKPPANGLLVPELISVAHDTLKARSFLINGVRTLLKAFPVKACRYCSEVHVGPVGHQIASCQGPYNGPRHGRHDWLHGDIKDVFPSMDVFHLSDRLGKVITHEERLRVEKLPAVIELCIQAGVDIAGYPTKRRTKPVVRIQKKPIDFDELDSEEGPDRWIPRPARAKKYTDFTLCSESNGTVEISSANGQELADLAEKTLQAWNVMRSGARKLMVKYSVQVCGYCPQVHVGPNGSKTKDCMAFKHQMRAGHHGWQDASIDDLIPPKYVWHLQDRDGPPLVTELRVFYGVTPAVVELCAQAGAAVPERYKPMMRLDVVIPDLNELDKVA